MTRYYKATRPDGTDFRTGTIDYAAALASGEVVRHPAAKKVRDDPSTYLSVSVEPADCTGFVWPCRLFRVEPVGRTMRATGLPNKRAVSALRVVEELPAWQAFGPNGEAVVALMEGAVRLTPSELRRLSAARDAAWSAARDAAWVAAWSAAWVAARVAAWDAARVAARHAAWMAAGLVMNDAAGAAAADAVLAVLVRDLITPEQFDILAKPWRDAGLPL